MTEIKNNKQLQEEITRLKGDIKLKEHQLRAQVTDLKDSLKPSHIFSSTYEKMTGEEAPEKGKRFTEQAVKTGLALVLGKILVKTEEKIEQRVYDAVDKVFDGLKDFLEKKTGRSRKNNTQPGEDDMGV